VAPMGFEVREALRKGRAPPPRDQVAEGPAYPTTHLTNHQPPTHPPTHSPTHSPTHPPTQPTHLQAAAGGPALELGRREVVQVQLVHAQALGVCVGGWVGVLVGGWVGGRAGGGGGWVGAWVGGFVWVGADLVEQGGLPLGRAARPLVLMYSTTAHTSVRCISGRSRARGTNPITITNHHRHLIRQTLGEHQHQH
jgi:hypothetical protein